MDYVMFGWWLAIPALAFVAVELLARAAIRRQGRYYVMPPGLRLRLHPDPDVFPQLERVTRFDVNSDGERGDEVPASGDVYRVLVAGGSQPEGFLLDQDTAWPGALQRLLETPERRRALGASRVHVGSIARSGVGSEALDLILRRILPRYPRLDLLVIMVGATDVLRWLEQGATPSTTPVRIADVFRCHPESTFGWTPRRLAVAEAVRRTRRRWLRPVEVHARAGRWIGQARVMRAQATERRSTTPDPTPMLDRFTRHFGSVLTTAKAHADRVLVVRQPWFDRDYSAGEAAQMWHGGAGQVWREQVTSFYSFDVCSRLMALLDSRVADVAGAHRVEQVDLMPVLDRSLDTYYDCFHLTPAGARAIAAVVAAATIARRMAPMYPASAGVPLRTPERSICVDLQAS